MSQLFRKRVLVLEDDLTLQTAIVTELKESGYFVLAAEKAAAACELAKRERFHLLLTDVRLAGGADGMVALEEIQKLRPGIKSIIMTGFASDSVPAQAMRLKADDYLLKGGSTFRLPLLLDTVERVLQQRERSGSGLWSWIGGLFSGKISTGSLRVLDNLCSETFAQLAVGIQSQYVNLAQAQGTWGVLLQQMERLGTATEATVPALTQVFRDVQTHLQAREQIAGTLSPAADDRLKQIYADTAAAKLDGPDLAILAMLEVDSGRSADSVQHYRLAQTYLVGLVESFRSPTAANPSTKNPPPGIRHFGKYTIIGAGKTDTERRVVDASGDEYFLRLFPMADTDRQKAWEDVTPPSEVVESGQAGGFYFRVRPSGEARDASPPFSELMISGGISLRECLEAYGSFFERLDRAHAAGLFDGLLGLARTFATEKGAVLSGFGEHAEALSEFRRCRQTNQPFRARPEFLWTAPELFTGPLRPASDQFQLGGDILRLLLGSKYSRGDYYTLMHTLAGQPFQLEQTSMGQELRAKMNSTAPLLRMLEKDPEQRFSSLEEAKQALLQTAL